MSIPSTASEMRLGHRVLARWGLLIGLLMAEAIALTLRFDAAGRGRHTALAPAIALIKVGFQLAVVGLAAVLLVLGPRLAEAIRLAGSAVPPWRRAWPHLAAHLVALAAFAMMTATVLEGGPRAPAASLAWATAWSAVAALTVLTCLAAGLDPSRWGLFLRGGPALSMGVAAATLAAWGASKLAADLWNPLGYPTLLVVRGLLAAVSSSVVFDPAGFRIGTPGFVVRIAPACSGFEGMGLVVVLIVAYLWSARRSLRFPRALLLIPIGVALMWAANALRIAALIVIGDRVSGPLALESFHSQAGWLAFNAVGLGLIVAARRLAFFSIEEADDPEPHPTAPYLVPFLVLVGSGLISSAFTRGFDPTYPARVGLVAAALLWFRHRYRELTWTPSWPAVGVGIAVFAFWMALEPADTPSRVLPRGGWWDFWTISRVVGSVLVIPLVEELAFRGYLMRRLIAADVGSIPVGTGNLMSLAVSSALFGLLHPGRWMAGTLAGLAFGLILTRRRSLGDAVVVHATANLLIAAHVLITGDSSPWS